MAGLTRPLSGRLEPLQLSGWPPRPHHQLAAAVRAHAMQHVRAAIPAERALERADHGIGGVGWQVAAATFAVGTQFEHGHYFSASLVGSGGWQLTGHQVAGYPAGDRG